MGLCQLFFRQFQGDVYFLGGKKTAGFYNIGNGSDIGMLYLLTVDKIIHKITTGMNPKASFGIVSLQADGYHTLRFAGLFNFPISLRFAIEIGVSRINFAVILFHRVIDYQTDSFMIFNFCLLKRGGKTGVRR